MGFRDCVKQDEIVEMDSLIEDFIKAPVYETELAIDIRETTLNGRKVVMRFVIEEIEEE